MIEGTVEFLTPEGIFGGWLRDTRDPTPAQIQIRSTDAILAESMASAFRVDLLRGGHGHGHYGFPRPRPHAPGAGREPVRTLSAQA